MSLKKRWPDLLAAVAWALVATFRLAAYLAKPAPLSAGQFLFVLIIMGLFVIRRPARAQGATLTFWLAVVATFLPALGLRPAETGLAGPGLALQSGGLALMLLSIAFLNRSFGLAPAHRGLVTRGPYRLVRHPLYAGEIIAVTGYCLGFVSPSNWIVLALFALATVGRIYAEERLLSVDEDYRAYRQRVRWRLLPGAW